MSTAIQWTHIPGYASDVWNPTTGCTSNGTGCDLCYARTLTNMRHKAYKAGKLQNMPHYAHPFSVVQQHPVRLANPLKVKRPTCYFVNSMSDLFHEEVPFSFVDQVFAVMAMCPQHIFIVLTKRPERMALYTAGARELAQGQPQISQMAQMNAADAMRDRLTLALGFATGEAQRRREDAAVWQFANAWNKRPDEWFQWPLPNVWMGASASTQAEVDAAVPHVLKTNAAVRLMSLEPLVEAVTLDLQYPDGRRIRPLQRDAYNPSSTIGMWLPMDTGLDWVIVGGESGTTKQKPRPMNPYWVRAIRDECSATGTAFFFKQWGALLPFCQAKHNAPHLAQREDGWVEFNGTMYRRAGKTANGHLLDGKEEFAWPITELGVSELDDRSPRRRAASRLDDRSPRRRAASRLDDRSPRRRAASRLDDRSPRAASGSARDDVKESAR